MACSIAFAGPAALAAATPQAVAGPTLSYADLVDLAQTAPIVAAVELRDATRLTPEQAGAVPQGAARLYVEADIVTLVRGAGGLPPRIHYLADVPLDARGKVPKLRKARKLIFALPVAGKPDTVQLLSPAAQVDWRAGDEERLRSVVAELVAADAPPRVTGVGHAFHVPGSLPGESETQIFLQTADRRPVSLNILRRPGEEPRWAVALGEMVDEAALPPKPDTLLWYRLACTLPPALPAAATADLPEADARAAAQDYALVIKGLGRCARTITAQKEASSTPTASQSE